MVADGLAGRGPVAFEVHSGTRPWKGTFADVDRAARALASSLRAGGVGPGDVVVVQLPNWLEAGVTFWAAAYLGAVVVPIVHFYGAKEVEYILSATRPDVVVTAERFGHNDYLATYSELLRRRPGRAGWWWRTPLRPASRWGRSLRLHARGRGHRQPRRRGPRLADHHRLHVRDHTRPQGGRALPSHIGCETRQLDYMFPKGGPPQITGRPGAIHRHGQRLSSAVARTVRSTLVDVWDPGEVLRLMAEEGLGVGGGATYFLTSLLDHPTSPPGTWP